jgi:hypothetical protein
MPLYYLNMKITYENNTYIYFFTLEMPKRSVNQQETISFQLNRVITGPLHKIQLGCTDKVLTIQYIFCSSNMK